MKKYFIQKVLKPLVHDLKNLEVEGIQILHNERNFVFRGTVSFISADNLAAHHVGGFNESFSSTRCCRTCHASRDRRQNIMRYDQCHRRTKDSYAPQCHAVHVDPSLSRTYRVKSKSVFNDLQHFHGTKGLLQILVMTCLRALCQIYLRE